MRGQNPLTDFINAVVRRFRLTDGTVLDLGAVADGEYLKRVGTGITGGTPSTSTNRILIFEFDGRSSAIDPLTQPDAVLPFSPLSGTIIEAYIKDLDDTSGSCVIDVRAASRGSAPPGSGQSLVGAGTAPSTSTATESTLSDLSDWTSDHINLNDEVRAVIASNSNHKHLTLTLTVEPD